MVGHLCWSGDPRQFPRVVAGVVTEVGRLVGWVLRVEESVSLDPGGRIPIILRRFLLKLGSLDELFSHC